MKRPRKQKPTGPVINDPTHKAFGGWGKPEKSGKGTLVMDVCENLLESAPTRGPGR